MERPWQCHFFLEHSAPKCKELLLPQLRYTVWEQSSCEQRVLKLRLKLGKLVNAFVEVLCGSKRRLRSAALTVLKSVLFCHNLS